MFESRIGGRYNQHSAEEVNMSIAAGIVTSITTACTLVWCTVGDRIAAVPAVGRVIAYVDGGHNIPSDAQVDALMAEARRRTDHGVRDRDELVPGKFSQTYGESLASTLMRNCVSEDAIEDASDVVEVSRRSAWREWLAGGYNMPKTHDEIDAFPPHTLRGAWRWPIPDGFKFGDET